MYDLMGVLHVTKQECTPVAHGTINFFLIDVCVNEILL